MRGTTLTSAHIVMVFFGLVALYILRDLSGALTPPLFNEDGPNMLEFYTAGHEPARIFRFYGGYISVGPNLMGYLIGFLPISAAAYALYWAPVAVTALTFAALCHPNFVLPGITTKERLFIALLLGLFPASNMALVSNTTFALWNLAIGLFLMALLWSPKTWPGAFLAAIFGIIAATSHPVSIVLLPVLLWRIWFAQDSNERLAFLPILAVIPIYLLLGVTSTKLSGSIDVVATLWEGVRLFFERGIFETLFSTRVRTIFLNRGLEPLIWIFGTGLIALMLTRVTGHVRLLVFALLALGFGNSLFSAVVRDMPLMGRWGHRYGYLTGVLVLMAAAISLLPTLRTWPSAGGLARKVFIASLIAVALVSSLLKLPYYRNEPAKSAEVAQLLDAVRQSDGPYCLRVERGEWSFAVRNTATAPCETLPPVRK